ncbi:hypothetical protein PF008_g26762 [Phytophthora fragariae]|uniref:Uncharacterized protein n=1 Tax=Phytophthora fragariae TaxID=53985 RepID=A0A6G0QG33_9STRA|nr:hypothetical protein PF008_g26762 [Phytophthora fragariae]
MCRRLLPNSGHITPQNGVRGGEVVVIDGASASSAVAASPAANLDHEAQDGLADDAAVVVPFFGSVVPPVSSADEWNGFDHTPWPISVMSWRLSSISALDLRDRLSQLRGWILPDKSEPEPARWNGDLITAQNVTALYDRRPWEYLEVLLVPITFELTDRDFAQLVARYTKHLKSSARAYWESTHRLPFPKTQAFALLRDEAKRRRSRAGDHLASVMRLLIELFQYGLADLDLLLDPLFMCLPPRAVQHRWYPAAHVGTLEDALRIVDAEQPWRRFYRETVESTDDAARVVTVGNGHPAHRVARLRQKFVQQF